MTIFFSLYTTISQQSARETGGSGAIPRRGAENGDIVEGKREGVRA